MAPGAPIARRSPRGTMKDVLELGHGFSHEMLAMLVLAGLATVVTETLRVDGGTFKIERVRITDWQFEVDRTQTVVRPTGGNAPLWPALDSCVSVFIAFVTRDPGPGFSPHHGVGKIDHGHFHRRRCQ